MNPQNVSTSAKTRKINIENTKLRKRRAKQNQHKRKLTTRKRANNRKLEENRGKTAKTGKAKSEPYKQHVHKASRKRRKAPGAKRESRGKQEGKSRANRACSNEHSAPNKSWSNEWNATSRHFPGVITPISRQRVQAALG